MDLGVFRRSKAGFTAWIAVPAVLVVALATAPPMLHRHMARSLDESRQWTELIPEMQSRLKAVQEQMRNFSIPSVGLSDASEAIRTRINRAARQAGMVVDSLVVEQSEEAPSDSSSLGKAGAMIAGALAADGKANPVRTLRLTVVGEGSSLTITRFLADVETQNNLTEVESASLSLTRNKPEAYYSGRFVMRCYVVSEQTSR